MDVTEKVCITIRDVAGLDEVFPEEHLFRDLDLNEYIGYDVYMKLKESFPDIPITVEEAREFEYVQDVINFIEKRI